MVLASATLLASVIAVQSQFKAIRAEELDRTVMPVAAARAADILDDHGMGALADLLNSLQTTSHWQAYLFDDGGKEILSQPSPPEVDAIAQSALADRRNSLRDISRHQVRRDENHRFHRHTLRTSDRRAYRVRGRSAWCSRPNSNCSCCSGLIHRRCCLFLANGLHHGPRSPLSCRHP